MARKSDKSKQGSPEKPRKSTRQSSRRRKKSTSDSETEEADTSEAESSKVKPTRRSARTRGGTSSTPDPPQPEPIPEEPVKEEDKVVVPPQEEEKVWEAQPVMDKDKEPQQEEEGTWKIQSSNGSGGELQKLKICRQRLTDRDSAESSSSPAKEILNSPRRKRYTKRATRGKTDVPDKVESSGSHTDTEFTEQQDIDDTIEPEAAEDQESVDTTDSGKERTEDQIAAEHLEASAAVEAIQQIEELEGVVVEADEQIEETEVIISETVKEIQEEPVDEIVEEKKETEVIVAESEEIKPDETRQEVEKSSEVIEKSPEKEVEKSSKPLQQNLDKKDDNKVDSVKKPKNLKLSVSNEVAMEQIAKKLNERAMARTSAKENSEERKTQDVDETGSPLQTEFDTTREEGEISSSAADTPEPAAKSRDVANKPASLRRLLDEEGNSQRKRRAAQMKHDDHIVISSNSLKSIAPEAAPLTLHEVEKSLTAEEKKEQAMNALRLERTKISEEPKIKRNFEVKEEEKENSIEPPRKVKRQIVIEHEKSASQDNHKLIRKISLVSDDPKTFKRSHSPPLNKASQVLYITNLVRPFTVPQLKELLARTGTIASNGFYIDKIKSKCFVKYTDVEMAKETRDALHGVRWPLNNPKTLRVDFSTDQAMSVMQQVTEDEHKAAKKQDPAAVIEKENSSWKYDKAVSPPKTKKGTVREWDMGKTAGDNSVTQGKEMVKKNDGILGSKNREKQRRTPEVENRRRAHSPEKYETTKKKKRDTEAPAKLLDDLFKKTKATPCIYWLPLTDSQIAVKEEMRRKHVEEHERRIAELRKRRTVSPRRDKDRDKSRDREKEREREKDKDKERERDRIKRKK